MVASIIAYALTVLFAGPAIYGIYQIASDQEPPGKTGVYIFSSIAMLFAAWGCAYIGGI